MTAYFFTQPFAKKDIYIQVRNEICKMLGERQWSLKIQSTSVKIRDFSLSEVRGFDLDVSNITVEKLPLIVALVGIRD